MKKYNQILIILILSCANVLLSQVALNPKWKFSTTDVLSRGENRPAKMNYHPSIGFDGKYDFEQVDIRDLTKMTLFAVYANSNGSDPVAYIENSNTPFEIKSNAVYHRRETPFVLDTKDKPKLLTVIDKLSKKKGKNKFLNFGDLTKSEGNFHGMLSEVLIYDRYLNSNEVRLIETSLALKYGIPFSDTSKFINSKFECIFDGSIQKPFSYNQTAIGYDLGTSFDQQQSKSSDSDAGLSISIGPLKKENGPFQKLKNQENVYIFLSDNNEEASLLPINGNFSSLKTKRKWKLQLPSSDFEFNQGNQLFITLDPKTINGYNPNLDTYIECSSTNNEINIKFKLIEEGLLQLSIPEGLLTANSSLVFNLRQVEKNKTLFFSTDYNCENKKGSITIDDLENSINKYSLIMNGNILKEISSDMVIIFEGLESGNYIIKTQSSSNTPAEHMIEMKPKDCENDFKIFPNPAQINQKISLIAENFTITQVEIHSAEGKLIKTDFHPVENGIEFIIKDSGVFQIGIVDPLGKKYTGSLIIMK